MKNIILVITSVISFISISLVILAILFYFHFDDTVQNEFVNYEEMIESSTFRGGWLPEYLPKSSTKIKERHDFDTNHIFATFNYDHEEELQAIKVCITSPIDNGAIKFLCPPYFGFKNILVLHQNGNGHFESEKAYHDDESKNL